MFYNIDIAPLSRNKNKKEGGGNIQCSLLKETQIRFQMK